MITYNDMTKQEAALHRALSAIAEGADPALRPGHIAYMSKSEIVAAAREALLEWAAIAAVE